MNPAVRGSNSLSIRHSVSIHLTVKSAIAVSWIFTKTP